MKILIIDDQKERRHQLEYLLKTAGHQVVLAADEKEALEKQRRRRFDMIVPNIDRPAIDLFKIQENDIEERTRELTAANRQLRCEKEVAQQYLDIAGVIMVVINADHTVALINKKGCDILGYQCSEIIGKKWFDNFVPERFREEVKKVFTKLMSGELSPVEYHENPVVAKNGEERLIAWHNALIKDEDGKIISTLSSGQDITERRQAQEMLIQNEKMITVGSLAAGMAHEINNPLAGILQGIQVIQGRLSPDLPANRKAAEECGVSIETVNAYLVRRNISKFLSAAKEAGERAAAIVENMLSFCRKSEASFSLQDIGQLLDKTIALAENEYDLKKKFDFHQIKITREYTPGLPSVPCEAIEIQQVILNLLKNAAQALFQAIPQIPRITLRTLKEEHTIRIEVEDNGPGMTDEIRGRIFEPFFTTKGIGQGTGLGLSVSHFIITENHGGSIDVKSVPGHGSTFFIRLPIHGKGKEKIK